MEKNHNVMGIGPINQLNHVSVKTAVFTVIIFIITNSPSAKINKGQKRIILFL